MNKKIQINTMIARNVFGNESFLFIKKIIEQFCNCQIPDKAKEIHKQNKAHDYTDEFRIYGTNERGIKYHSYYKIIDKEKSTTALLTITNESFGFPDFWIKFIISSSDGLILEIESDDKSILDKVTNFFEEEFGFTREQSKDEIFDELIHEIRTRGTEKKGKYGIEVGLKAIEIFPDDFWAQFYLGCSYALNEQYDKSIDHLEKAVKLDSSNYDALYNLAKSYLEMNRLVDAKKVILKAKKIAQKNHIITYYAALIFDKIENKEEAIKYYEETIATAPENIDSEKIPIKSYLKEAQKRLKELKI
ncbi:MAG: tetratricopeptide repeat protein [Candidatus Heimdallarchaeota archaeon]|nr:tetratricopeptide repeat protein [Candidatus Heimdallarchaeota archaeon]